MNPTLRKVENAHEPTWLLTVPTRDAHISVMLDWHQVMVLKVQADLAVKYERARQTAEAAG